ncbi:LysR family transcriptional regulator [Citrobacter freundii]|uniref:LysR family transcriptional regulator n=1 Tax=Citrobacter freundii TaxID=546 RepID=UPI0008FD4903|nr:LysR family transcriptional regulator [Citrobacter freundii]EKW7211320.1 LysR family transcriptional regulator [Citrobacter freundii]ELO0987933.1 LysR family transcriptional regulator [Citrobacter freundii]MDE8800899.1 LysR family transcriptional regulator [Citrobacter freundii]MDE8806026.1 LysR family transcriptional regulator [Citrobacter freundii]OIZ44207.1 LysR family transcriptional regulator [Citrobacter freundii]
MQTKDIRAIDILAKAVELGSLRQAAQVKGVTPQAASQSLAQLEESLGVRLLHRTTRNLSLTEEGRRLLDATQPAMAVLERALTRARQAKDEIAGPLRIVGPRSAFTPVLWPVIDEYCRRYPDVQPEVQLDDNVGDWVLDRVDVGFRVGSPPAEGLIARPLFSAQLIICASPDYLRQHGTPRSLEELAFHRCSVFRHPGTGAIFPWYVNVEGEIQTREFPPTVATNSTDIEVEATLTGQVIAQLSSLSAAALIRQGRLVPLLTQHTASHLHLYAYYGSRKAQPLRVRKFIDLAVERLTESRELTLTSEEFEAYGVK